MQFEGHDNPQPPTLKWFLYDDNIKNLIEMRMNRAIKSNVLELKGSSSLAMSKAIACAIDDVMRVNGGASLEKRSLKEQSKILVFEIEF